MFGISLRGLVIIDHNQKIRSITINDEQVGRNVDETFRLVQACRHTDKNGVVCRANWTPGSKTIIPDQTKMGEYFGEMWSNIIQSIIIDINHYLEIPLIKFSWKSELILSILPGLIIIDISFFQFFHPHSVLIVSCIIFKCSREVVGPWFFLVFGYFCSSFLFLFSGFWLNLSLIHDFQTSISLLNNFICFFVVGFGFVSFFIRNF